MKEIRLFEAFAGVGAQYKALKNISKKMDWEIKLVGMIEWFVDAIIGYIAIHCERFNADAEKLDENIRNISLDSKSLISDFGYRKIKNSEKSCYLNYAKDELNNLFDINDVTEKEMVKNIDIFTYSFPCQDLSLQGKQKGIDKKVETRSGLLWQVERILESTRTQWELKELPKYLLMENVGNILNKKHKKDFDNWIEKLMCLGYESKVYKLNAYNFGLAQNRERVFCLSVRMDWKERVGFEFVENFKIKKNRVLKDVVDLKDETDLIDLSGFGMSEYRETKNKIIKKRIIDYSKFETENYVYSVNGVGPTLTASGANSRIKIELKENVYRYMKPLECFRYMGFSTKDFYRVKKTGLLNNQKIIYLAGNAIPVPVLEEIFKTLKF